MPNEWDEGEAEAHSPRRRTPGKYVVYGMIAFWVIVFGFSLVLALRLEPAADRFHKPTATTQK